MKRRDHRGDVGELEVDIIQVDELTAGVAGGITQVNELEAGDGHG